MKKSKNKSIISFTIRMLFLFTFVLLISSIIGSIMNIFISYGKYGLDFIGEASMAMVMLIIMLASGNRYVFSNEKRKPFLKSIKEGSSILIISFIALFFAIISLIGSGESLNIFNFVSLVLYTLMIGVFEEFLSRGWLQNEFIERFGKTKKGVLISIIISGAFFGIMHITNIFAGQDVFSTILQVINATSAGAFFGIIYYRTKNIWACVFLHGFYDFCLMLSNVNEIKDSTISGANITSIFTILFLGLLWIFSIAKLLYKTEFVENEEKLEVKEVNNNNKTIKLCNIMSIICVIGFFASSFIPEEMNIIEYRYEPLSVYEYKVSYLNYDNYVIKHKISDNETVGLIIELNDNDRLQIKNITTNQMIELEYDVISYVVIDNELYYGILVYDFTSYDVYYLEMLKSEMNNTNDYLQNIKDSFVSYGVPSLENGGYIELEGDLNKYPYLLSSSKDEFIIMNNSIYKIEK